MTDTNPTRPKGAATSDNRKQHMRRAVVDASNWPGELVGYCLLTVYRDEEGELLPSEWSSAESRLMLQGARMESMMATSAFGQGLNTEFSGEEED